MAAHRHIGKYLALAGALFLGVGLVAPAEASGGPPGDNGTVKVDGWEVDNTPANEPHIGCQFGIDFYGYEAGLRAVMEFWVQPPTGQEAMINSTTGTLDDDDASSGGSDQGFDGHFDIDLADALDPYTPHPQQGYHLKLVVTVDDGVGGNSIVKHKVFWTTACEPPTTTTTETSTTLPETTTTETSTTLPETTTTETSTTLPETTTTSTSTTVLGTQVTQGTPTTAAPTEVLGVQLVRTGFGTTMLVLGTGLLVLGLVVELLQQAAVRKAR